MAKSLLKLLLLGALSAGASSLPNFLGGLPGSAAGKIPGHQRTGTAKESATELSRELADVPRAIAELKSLGNPRPRSVAGLSKAERDLMRDAAPGLKFKSNTLTRQLGLAPKKGSPPGGGALPAAAGKIISRLRTGPAPKFQSFSEFRTDLLGFYDEHPSARAYLLWLVPAAAVAISFLLFLCKRYTLSMALTGLLFALSNFLLWALSAAVVLSTLLTKQSLLPALPHELWLSPVVFLVVSAGMLRLADENYPFWNKTVHTLFTPIAASCLAAGWLNGVSFLKSLPG